MHNFGTPGKNIIQTFMSNILILGIDGMLGNMLANVFSQKSSGKLFFTSRRDEPINEYLNVRLLTLMLYQWDLLTLYPRSNQILS